MLSLRGGLLSCESETLLLSRLTAKEQGTVAVGEGDADAMIGVLSRTHRTALTSMSKAVAT